MAQPHGKALHLAAILLLFAHLLISFPCFSSARLLNFPADEPALVLRLPGDDVVVAYPLEKDSQRVLPCADAESSMPKLGSAAPRLGRKYAPLVLARLPKGPVAPSGPSKRTNSLNN